MDDVNFYVFKLLKIIIQRFAKCFNSDLKSVFYEQKTRMM